MSWGLPHRVVDHLAARDVVQPGVNITAFVASLGVGGIAVALACKASWATCSHHCQLPSTNRLRWAMPLLSATCLARWNTWGFKTTRIRGTGGEQIIMSNTDLLKNTISNYKRLNERRAVFTFGVTYSTAPEAVAGDSRLDSPAD